MKIRSYRIPTALLLIFALLLTVCGSALEFPASAQDASANRNLSICLKDDWHVYVDYNDSGEENEWYTGFLGNGKTVSLPYDTAQDAWTSVIWFSNIFKADLGLQEGQRVVIDFEGVQYYAKIWLNGNYIGDHEGGVEGFSFDVTDYIRDGEDNLLALRLYTPRGEDTYEGGHDGELGWGLFGGTQRIQTPVYVRVVPEVYITDTYVNTNYADGTVDVELTVNNASYASRRVRVTTDIKESGESLSLQKTVKSFRVRARACSHIQWNWTTSKRGRPTSRTCTMLALCWRTAAAAFATIRILRWALRICAWTTRATLCSMASGSL